MFIKIIARLEQIQLYLINMQFFNKFLLAAKSAYNIPTLPDNILLIQNNPLIRILRFGGGFSFLMLLTKGYLKFHPVFLYIFYLVALIFTIYHFIITFYRIKHIFTEIKSDKFYIRNSPLDRLATLAAKAFFFLKGACETAQPIANTIALMITTDTILKVVNR